MMEMRSSPGFDVLPDGSIIIRYGNNSSREGIVQIHFQIELLEDAGVEFTLAGVKDELVDLFVNPFISGVDMPEKLQNAVLTGLIEGLAESSRSSGIKFTLFSAFANPYCSDEFNFRFLGKLSFFAWDSSRFNRSKNSWDFSESYKICRILYGWSD